MKRAIILVFLISFCGASDLFNVPGWEVKEDILRYESGNLWEYIDGAADQFLDFGFESLQTTELRSDNTLLTVEIYNMAQPINAFGIYMMERPEGTSVLKIGTESVINMSSQALMLKDYWYVKMQILEGGLDSNGWKSLLAGIADNLPGKNTWPDELKLLPTRGMVPNSIRYVKTNFLGLSGLNNCIYADYTNKNNEQFQYFAVVKLGDLLNTLEEKWKIEDEIWIRKIPYQGFIGIRIENNLAVGVAKISDKQEVIKLLNNL
jgi:hypothetical protein